MHPPIDRGCVGTELSRTPVDLNKERDRLLPGLHLPHLEQHLEGKAVVPFISIASDVGCGGVAARQQHVAW